ncbi:hypothetical protein V8G54_016808 [Vigna mungo]|uniref:Serine aminopeptidase S33 domain-containing protein n=1 Tax=Vigna mungo TaxID=3915 RepID=A0AAQ3NPU6_VIGMU
MDDRVFTIHGSSDPVIPVEDAYEFAKILPNHKLHIIEGADHSYTNHQDELASVVVNCIKETLLQDRKKVIIQNKYGYKLVGILHESGTEEIVILCHGGRASKENFIMTNLAAALENAGISSFRFDFTGNGESEGSFEIGGFWREADDIHAVAQHFLKANRTVIAIVGHSKGANAAILYASKYNDVKTIVNLSGTHDLKNFWKESGMKVSLSWRQHQINDRFFTVHGSADIQIPALAAVEFDKILPNHKFHIIEGADHVYSDHQDELASVVVNFINETLNKDKVSSQFNPALMSKFSAMDEPAYDVPQYVLNFSGLYLLN